MKKGKSSPTPPFKDSILEPRPTFSRICTDATEAFGLLHRLDAQLPGRKSFQSAHVRSMKVSSCQLLDGNQSYKNICDPIFWMDVFHDFQLASHQIVTTV